MTDHAEADPRKAAGRDRRAIDGRWVLDVSASPRRCRRPRGSLLMIRGAGTPADKQTVLLGRARCWR